MKLQAPKLIKIYKILLERLGPQGWWPINGVYDPRKIRFSRAEKFEIMAGAVLTQNANWKNAEKALGNLRKSGFLSAEKIAGAKKTELEVLIRPSGFFRQKAARLKRLSQFAASKGKLLAAATRAELLSIDGIGPETADSILLYAFGRPYFVADAYTRRLAGRLGIIENGGYEETRAFFESRLPRDAGIYREYHALIVELSKKFCRKNPDCSGCPLESLCRAGRRKNEKKR